MNRFRNLVLPIAIVLGLIFHSYCRTLQVCVPYLIFTILLLNFVATDIKKLRFTAMDALLMLVQVSLSLGIYIVLVFCGVDEIVSQGVLVGVLCPVAASVVVISCMLGANRETVTTYTIVGNLMVAVVAPVAFTLIGDRPELSLTEGLMLMVGKIGSTLALPFFIAVILQFLLPRVNGFFASHNGVAFYLWALALTFTLGQTIDYIFLHGEGNWGAIAWLGGLSLLFCIVQFAFGRWLGRRYGDVVGGGQLLGQKNTAMGIWMANTFLSPLSSVFMAFYSVYQNLFNAYQISKTKSGKTKQ